MGVRRLQPRTTTNCVLRGMAADEWADLFARENSGTHNNQWIVVDYKQFHKAKQGTSLAQRKTALLLLQRSHMCFIGGQSVR